MSNKTSTYLEQMEEIAILHEIKSFTYIMYSEISETYEYQNIIE